MKNSNEFWEQKERKILLILFKKTGEFFINDTTQESIWKYYDGHFRGRNELTRERFDACKESGDLPSIYLLSTVTGTKNDAFQLKLAWSKYFVECGYSPIAGPKMQAIIDDYKPEEGDLYGGIKDIPLDEIIGKGKDLLPNFQREGKQRRTETSSLKPGEHQITLRISEEEHRVYASRAREYCISLNEYIRDCIRLGGVFQVDTTFLEKYVRAINNCYNIFSGILATILISKEYYPSDVRQMDEIRKQILDSNTEVKHEIIRLCRQLRRMKTGEQINKNPVKRK